MGSRSAIVGVFTVLLLFVGSDVAGPALASHFQSSLIIVEDERGEIDPRLAQHGIWQSIAPNADIDRAIITPNPKTIRFQWDQGQLTSRVPLSFLPPTPNPSLRGSDLIVPGREPSVHYRISFEVPFGFVTPAMLNCEQYWFVYVSVIAPKGGWLSGPRPAGWPQAMGQRPPWPFDTEEPQPFSGSQMEWGIGCRSFDADVVMSAYNARAMGAPGFTADPPVDPTPGDTNPALQAWYAPRGDPDSIMLVVDRSKFGIPEGLVIRNVTAQVMDLTLRVFTGSTAPNGQTGLILMRGNLLDDAIVPGPVRF